MKASGFRLPPFRTGCYLYQLDGYGIAKIDIGHRYQIGSKCRLVTGNALIDYRA